MSDFEIEDGMLTRYTGHAAEVVIPDNVTTIGKYAFGGCTSLTSITIPGSVTAIGEFAFAGCTSLTSITLPDNLTTIGRYAFADCTSLTSIIVDSEREVDRVTLLLPTELRDKVKVSYRKQHQKNIEAIKRRVLSDPQSRFNLFDSTTGAIEIGSHPESIIQGFLTEENLETCYPTFFRCVKDVKPPKSPLLEPTTAEEKDAYKKELGGYEANLLSLSFLSLIEEKSLFEKKRCVI